jgi:hypothetical protein
VLEERGVFRFPKSESTLLLIIADGSNYVRHGTPLLSNGHGSKSEFYEKNSDSQIIDNEGDETFVPTTKYNALSPFSPFVHATSTFAIFSTRIQYQHISFHVDGLGKPPLHT